MFIYYPNNNAYKHKQNTGTDMVQASTMANMPNKQYRSTNKHVTKNKARQKQST